MRVIQSSLHFPLASVKPLERLLGYRAFCLQVTHDALAQGAVERTSSPVTGRPGEPFGMVDGFRYLRCPDTGSVFLDRTAREWGRLLAAVSAYRQSPQAFQADLAAVRAESVYLPKLDWIATTLRIQGIARPRVLEVVTPPSEFTALLRTALGSDSVVVATESDLVTAGREGRSSGPVVQAAVLLEALDRVDDPVALLRGVYLAVAPEGLIFVTGLVVSGFDMAVLGTRSRYLYPPDRANCFTLAGLQQLLIQSGFELLEVSTPGLLDVEIMQAHLAEDPSLELPPFERALVTADEETRQAFQTFLQENRLSSFARLVGIKRG